MEIGQHVLATTAPPLSPFMEEAARLRAAGRDPLMLAQAMVAYPPPRIFTDSLSRALRDGMPHLHHYAPDPGLPELQEALAAYLECAFGFRPDPQSEILITAGANHAAYLALSAILEPGDEVIVVSPWYFNHVMTVQLLGGQCQRVTAAAHEGFTPSIDAILAARGPRTRAVILVNPNNPSGARYADDWIAAFAAAVTSSAAWERVWLLADQTYQEIFYTGAHPRSLAALPELQGRVLTAGSFSKCFALAGWRVGFLVGPAEFIVEALKIQDSSVICAPRPAQWAVARTLEHEGELAGYFAGMREVLRGRRDALLAGLGDGTQLQLSPPAGSCFTMLGLPEGIEGVAFSRALLAGREVVTIPGDAFGPEWAAFLRLSFGTETEERLAEAGVRIGELLAEWLERDR